MVSVGYRPAPEHPFPAAVEDALAAATHRFAHALDFGIDAARLGICGDSAGGTLAAITCERLPHLGAPRPALQLLLCSILDHDSSITVGRDFSGGDPLDQTTLDHDLQHYLPDGAARADPRVSPLCAEDLTALPPTIIHTAECDPLRDDGQRDFDRIKAPGVATIHCRHPGMLHMFYGLGGVIPYARHAFEVIGDAGQVFRLTAYERLSFVFEGTRSTAHWRADIHSKITGVSVPTELVDLVEFSGDRIVTYCEFFVPQALGNPPGT